MKRVMMAAAMAVALATAGAFAEVIFNAETGTGFVGKGDVQTAMGWNNRQLQENADSLVFTVHASTETTWECLNTFNENEQLRRRTSTIQGVVSHVARERNQITGFILTGYDGEVIEGETEGPPLNDCPNGRDWTFVEGSTRTTGGEGSGLFVNGVPLQ